MARLPEVESYNLSPDEIRRYFDSCLDLRKSVVERSQAAKLPVKALNDARKRFTQQHGLYTPGLDWVLKLEFEFTPRARRQWLNFFDAGREIRGLDRLTEEQMDMLEGFDGEAAADALASTAA